LCIRAINLINFSTIINWKVSRIYFITNINAIDLDLVGVFNMRKNSTRYEQINNWTNLNIRDWKDSSKSMSLTIEPVLVDLTKQVQVVTFSKRQFSPTLSTKRIKSTCFTTRLWWHWRWRSTRPSIRILFILIVTCQRNRSFLEWTTIKTTSSATSQAKNCIKYIIVQKHKAPIAHYTELNEDTNLRCFCLNNQMQLRQYIII